MRLCGRYGYEPEVMWSSTPSEFIELMEGAREGERDESLRFASILSTLLAFGGTRISPAALIGEAEDYGESPFDSADTPEERRRRLERFREAKAKAAEKAHRAWMPPGIGLGDEEG